MRVERRRESRVPPPKVGNKRQRCCRFMHNKQEKLWCGRTWPSWFKIILYYIMFVTILLILVLIFMMFLYRYKRQNDLPPIKKLHFIENAFPVPALLPARVNKMSNIIWYTFSGKDCESNRRSSVYVDAINQKFREEELYCVDNKTCIFDRTLFGPCGDLDYGYEEKQPCVFLKLNKLVGWIPEAYESKEEIPKNIPNDLKGIVDVNLKKVWLHCGGKSIYSDEKIGKVEYYPGAYFDLRYFPIKPQARHSPMVAIKLTNLQAGYLVQFQCKIYAKNVHGGDSDVDVFIFVDIK